VFANGRESSQWDRLTHPCGRVQLASEVLPLGCQL